MNFSTDLDPFRPKPVFKGGRWKDRLHAKKSLRPRDPTKSQPPRNLTGPNTQTIEKARQFGQENEHQRPEKRRKTSNNTTTSELKTSTKPSHSKPKDAAGASIISSLFTSNPSTTSQIQTPNTPTKDLPPSNAPLPQTHDPFTALGLPPSLSAHLTRTLSLTAPTAIQAAALPILLKSTPTDAFIQAETGSGKTLAYLLPIIHHILALKPTSHTNTTAIQNQNSINRTSGSAIFRPALSIILFTQKILGRGGKAMRERGRR